MYLAEGINDRKKIAQEIEIIAEKFLKEQPLEDQQILLDPPTEKTQIDNFPFTAFRAKRYIY